MATWRERNADGDFEDVTVEERYDGERGPFASDPAAAYTPDKYDDSGPDNYDSPYPDVDAGAVDETNDTTLVHNYRAVGQIRIETKPTSSKQAVRLEDLNDLIQFTAVANIDAPDLTAFVGAFVGSLLIVTSSSVGPNEYTVYAWDNINLSGADSPYVLAGSSGFWTATAGKYQLGSRTIKGDLTGTGAGAFSGALTSTTLNTGQGANELYPMDQAVLTSSSPTFVTETLTGLTASLPVKTDASKVLVSGAINLASAEVTGLLPNANLANSSINITDTAGIGAGASVSLGGTLTLSNTTATPQFTRLGLGIAASAPYRLFTSEGTTSAIAINVSGGAGGDKSQLVFRFNNGRNGAVIQSVVGGSFVGDLQFYTNPTGASGAETEKMRILGNGNVGVGTTGPDAKVDSLTTSGAQYRATYTDGSVYTDMTTDSSGDFTIAPTGLDTKITGEAHVTAGTSTGHVAHIGGTLNSPFSSVGNVGTGTDDLMSYTIPANVMAADGDYIEFTFAGDIANTAVTKAIAVVVGTTSIAVYTLGASAAGAWMIQGRILRIGGGTAEVYITATTVAALLAMPIVTLRQNLSLAPSNWASSCVLKATANATNDNDVIQRVGIVKWGSVGT